MSCACWCSGVNVNEVWVPVWSSAAGGNPTWGVCVHNTDPMGCGAVSREEMLPSAAHRSLVLGQVWCRAVCVQAPMAPLKLKCLCRGRR